MSSSPAFFSAVIPAAGLSRRLGFDKLLTPVGGVTFLQCTLQRILKSPRISEIILVVSSETQGKVEEIVAKLQETRPIKLVLGGSERQDSVMAGLLATDPGSELVMIHDAARPFITPELIELVHAAALEKGAAVCGHPSTDTLKVAGEDLSILSTADREKTWAVQTPQIFRRSLILEAYEKIKASGKIITDDTAAVSEMGHPVKLVRFDGINLKITRPADWGIAIRILMSVDEDIKFTTEIRRLIHDISNQITSVMGFSFLLDMEVGEDSSLKDHVKALNDASGKCHSIVSAMQNVARDIHSKKIELQQSIEAKANS